MRQIKVTPMTKKEQRALREWVKDGNSVYENSMGAWADGQVPVEFLTIYRDEEYIREYTKGMSGKNAQKFAMNYYGWDTETDEVIVDYVDNSMDPDAELPFS